VKKKNRSGRTIKRVRPDKLKKRGGGTGRAVTYTSIGFHRKLGNSIWEDLKGVR